MTIPNFCSRNLRTFILISLFVSLASNSSYSQTSNEFALNIVEFGSSNDVEKLKDHTKQYGNKLTIQSADLNTRSIQCISATGLTIEEAIQHFRMLGVTAYYMKSGEIIYADEDLQIKATSESIESFTNRYLKIYKNKL